MRTGELNEEKRKWRLRAPPDSNTKSLAIPIGLEFEKNEDGKENSCSWGVTNIRRAVARRHGAVSNSEGTKYLREDVQRRGSFNSDDEVA